jgi:TonB family protein
VIASWMAYTALVSALLAIAGLALERVASGRRWPLRSVWIATLGASLAWSVAAAVRELLPERSEAMLPFTITLPTQVITAGAAGPDRALLVDRALLGLWIVGSAFLLFRLARAMRDLRRTRAAWRHGELDGMAVRFAPNVGPAVVGLRSMEVVLPEWILALDAPLRAIVLRHEEEHRRARDPFVLFGVAVAVALMPWNLALWFQARRLRLAIEMDCDARVLEVHPSAERYGLLMLTIAQRRSVMPVSFAPMLSEPTTQLERRIVAMRATRRLARATAVSAVALASAALMFACALETKSPLVPLTAPAPAQAPAQAKSPSYFEFQVEQAARPAPGNVAPKYPDMLRKAEVPGEVLAQFVVTAEGRADMSTFKVLKSTHDLLTASVRAALGTWQFEPAMVGGRPVKQLLQLPFNFTIEGPESGSVTTGKAVIPSPDAYRPRRGVVIEPRRMFERQTYFEFQVEKAVSPVPGGPSPRYPTALREAKVSGDVLAQFIVDENGRPEMDSFKVLKSEHEEFSLAVRSALPNMKFIAAQVGGRPVRQLVQMPFQFSLSK